MMAADSGELETPADVDSLLAELSKTGHKDATWRELTDALIDLRGLLAARPPIPDELGHERLPYRMDSYPCRPTAGAIHRGAARGDGTGLR